MCISIMRTSSLKLSILFVHCQDHYQHEELSTIRAFYTQLTYTQEALWVVTQLNVVHSSTC